MFYVCELPPFAWKMDRRFGFGGIDIRGMWRGCPRISCSRRRRHDHGGADNNCRGDDYHGCTHYHGGTFYDRRNHHNN
jgi:hypothetical protein